MQWVCGRAGLILGPGPFTAFGSLYLTLYISISVSLSLSALGMQVYFSFTQASHRQILQLDAQEREPSVCNVACH